MIRWLIFFLLAYAGAASAQKLRLEITDLETGKPVKLNYTRSFNSIPERTKHLQDVVSKLQQDGFITATADSLEEKGDTLNAFISKGKIYKWSRLYNINANDGALGSSGFRERLYKNRKFSYKQTGKLLSGSLAYYENNGYPFATIRLDSVVIDSSSVRAGICAEPGELFTIDSVTFKGTARITPRYLYNYIGVKPRDVYNEEILRQISTRLKELPFVTETRPADVFLLQNVALVRMYLNDKKASNFSGIVGFLPNNEKTGKLLLTGEANLKLKNSLGRGESIEADWKRLQAGTQSLNINVAYPFLFNTPFGADASFALYKRDSTFLNLQRSLGLQYLMRGTDYLKVFIENKSSNLLSTAGLQNVIVLPDYADIRSNLYGLELSLTRLDYRFNPRKGIRILARAAAGTRTIQKNLDLNEDLYEGLVLRSVQYNAHVDFDWFIPIRQRSTFNLGLLGSSLQGTNLFENELSRIGGINTLRGFDEESIFASTFAIITTEYRYLLEENSFLFLFWNGAYYENKAINRNIYDNPFGFGAGMSFQTKAGIFSISYALGKQFDNTIQFKTAKVHFGITSLF